MFPIVDFLTCQILSIIGLQIENEDFFFTRHIYKPKNMPFTIGQSIDNLNFLIFLSKNWSIDHNVDCKPHFNMLELIEKDLDLKKLENLESSFEWDEIVNI
jgi:hypothetical protein